MRMENLFLSQTFAIILLVEIYGCLTVKKGKKKYIKISCCRISPLEIYVLHLFQPPKQKQKDVLFVKNVGSFILEGNQVGNIVRFNSINCPKNPEKMRRHERLCFIVFEEWKRGENGNADFSCFFKRILKGKLV